MAKAVAGMSQKFRKRRTIFPSARVQEASTGLQNLLPELTESPYYSPANIRRLEKAVHDVVSRRTEPPSEDNPFPEDGDISKWDAVTIKESLRLLAVYGPEIFEAIEESDRLIHDPNAKSYDSAEDLRKAILEE